MRYQIPQFIEVEDKIIGPFTIKQFLYLVGGAGRAFVAYTFLPLWICVLVRGMIAALSRALAFYKINNKPFIDFLESAFLFYTKQNLYIWKKQPKPIEQSKIKAEAETAQVFVPKLSNSKLKELSWSLDINENLNPLTGQDGRNTK